MQKELKIKSVKFLEIHGQEGNPSKQVVALDLFDPKGEVGQQSGTMWRSMKAFKEDMTMADLTLTQKNMRYLTGATYSGDIVFRKKGDIHTSTNSETGETTEKEIANDSFILIDKFGSVNLSPSMIKIITESEIYADSLTRDNS